MSPSKHGLIVPGGDLETPDGRKAIVLPSGDIHVVEPPKAPELTRWQLFQQEIANSGGYFTQLRLARKIMGPSYVEALALRNINSRLPSWPSPPSSEL